MRLWRNLAFLIVAIIVLRSPTGPLTAQVSCTATATTCLNIGDCNTQSLPTCDTLCAQQCNGTTTSGDWQCGESGPISGCPSGKWRLTHLCSCVRPCTGNGGSCSSSGECCSGTCNNNQCASGSCTPDNESCYSSAECCSNDCAWGICYSTPVLLNLKNNSRNYQLTSALDGVAFDMHAKGILQQVGWTEPGSQIAFLVLDRNGNGLVDDGSEMFSAVVRKSNGELAKNGFDALLDLDGGPQGSDGQIDANDDVYRQLKLWLDENHNGVSEPSEFRTLQSEGIAAILTDYRESRRTDRNGNIYRYVGEARVLTNGQEVPRAIFDVLLKAAP